jgi:hypothetical protein
MWEGQGIRIWSELLKFGFQYLKFCGLLFIQGTVPQILKDPFVWSPYRIARRTRNALPCIVGRDEGGLQGASAVTSVLPTKRESILEMLRESCSLVTHVFWAIALRAQIWLGRSTPGG